MERNLEIADEEARKGAFSGRKEELRLF